MSRPIRSAPRALDSAPAESTLLAHRIGLTSGPRQGAAPAPLHGMGNCKHPSRNEDRAQADPQPHAKAKGEVVAPGRGTDGERSPRRLENVEKRWISIRRWMSIEEEERSAAS